MRFSRWIAHTLVSTLAVAAVVAIPARAAHAIKYASIVIDYDTGQVLHQVDADHQTYPASLTKMMTLYLLFDAMKAGRVKLDTDFKVSEHAASMSPSKLGLRPGETIEVEDALLGLVTRSANDAAVVVGENLAGGSEEAFARMMTARARRLGMSRTTFANASGLPNSAQITTARDMAILGRALIRDFPQYYPYFNTRSFEYEGKVIGNHNHLLGNYEGADGIKTGFIQASGYNLVASAKRDGRRLIGVVLGGQSWAWRDQHMVRLLDRGFETPRGTTTLVASAPMPQTVVTSTAPGVKTTKNAPAQIASAAPTRGQTPPPRLTEVGLRTNGRDQGDAEDRTSRALSRFSLDAPADDRIGPVTPAPADKSAAAKGAKTATAAAGNWTVQVGAFAGNSAAHAAAQTAINHAGNALTGGSIVVVPGHGKNNKPIYRARVTGLEEARAREACRILQAKDTSCMAMPPAS